VVAPDSPGADCRLAAHVCWGNAVIGVQELALIAVIVFLLCGPWIVRRIGASLAALRELGQ
jgi:hypothetical protein